MSSENKSLNRSSIRLNEILTVSDLLDFKAELLNEFRNILKEQVGRPAKKWLKTEEVKKLLAISTGKLQTLRINGTLPFTRIGGVLYYDADDIEQMFASGKFRHS
jgi:hypothetical protein